MVEISSWFSLFTQVCLLLTPHQDSWLVFPLNLLCGSNHSTYGFFLYFSNRVYTVYSGLLKGIHGLAPTFIIPSLLLCLLPHWKTCSLNMPVFCFLGFFCIYLCFSLSRMPLCPISFCPVALIKDPVLSEVFTNPLRWRWSNVPQNCHLSFYLVPSITVIYMYILAVFPARKFLEVRKQWWLQHWVSSLTLHSFPIK